jgi:hypothetical protein
MVTWTVFVAEYPTMVEGWVAVPLLYRGSTEYETVWIEPLAPRTLEIAWVTATVRLAFCCPAAVAVGPDVVTLTVICPWSGGT